MVYRIFIGIINKPEVEKIGRLIAEFLQKNGVIIDETGHIDVHAQGVFVSFTTLKAAIKAVELTDGKHFPEAVDSHVTVRRVLPREEDVTVLQRMEKELWIFIREKKETEMDWELIDNDLMKLIGYYQNVGVCPKAPGSLKEPNEIIKFNESLIDTPTTRCEKAGYISKFVVSMVSSEAVVVTANEKEFPAEVSSLGGLEFRTEISRACQFKHRHDCTSTMIHLPSRLRVVFDEKDFIDWLVGLGGCSVQRWRTKVQNQKIMQVFTENDDQMSKLINYVGKTPYKGTKVFALPWHQSVLYQYRNLIVNEEDRRDLEEIIEGTWNKDNKNPQSNHKENGTRVPEADFDEAENSFYPSIYHSPVPEIFFDVKRPANVFENCVQFYDLFVHSEGYFTPALKRTETVDKFSSQLEDFIWQTKAKGGRILNFYLAFDALAGIVFYLWFDKEEAMEAAKKMIANGKLYLRDVIQQTEGQHVLTQAVIGRGFYAQFPRGSIEVEMDLKEISKIHMDEDGY